MGCDDKPVLVYTGLILDKDRLAHLIGLPSIDPTAPGTYPDAELTDIINRYKLNLDQIALRRHREQCRAFELQKQAADAAVAAQVEQILLSQIFPEGAAEYADEVPIKLHASAAGPKIATDKPVISYGIIPEPYVNIPRNVVVLDTDNTRKTSTRDSEVLKQAVVSPFDRWRYDLIGRRIYVTNNGRNVLTAYVWLIQKERLTEFVESITPQLRSLEDFRFLENDELVADIVIDINNAMTAEARLALASLIGEGTRLELQGEN